MSGKSSKLNTSKESLFGIKHILHQTKNRTTILQRFETTVFDYTTTPCKVKLHKIQTLKKLKASHYTRGNQSEIPIKVSLSQRDQQPSSAQASESAIRDTYTQHCRALPTKLWLLSALNNWCRISFPYLSSNITHLPMTQQNRSRTVVKGIK